MLSKAKTSLFLKFVVLTELADQREPLILLRGRAGRVFVPCSNGLLSEKAFQRDTGLKERLPVTIATSKADGYLTATTGTLSKVA